MTTTTIRFPIPLLRKIDRLAADRGVSRERLIVESCQRMVGEQNRWPEAFFSNDHLDPEDLQDLQESSSQFLGIPAP